MLMRVKEVINLLNENLKLSNQESWDNSGLQIGDYNDEVKGIVLALDLSEDIIDYSIKEKANLIITHHPFLFSSIKCIDLATLQGRMINSIIKNNITVVSFHTSLDAAVNGITKELSKKLNVNEYTVLHENYVDDEKNIVGFGGIGYIEKTSLKKYANLVKDNLNCDAVKVYSNDINKDVCRVAFCGGSGSEFIRDAFSKLADVYITGDIKYHDAQFALNNNLSIIDAGHFYTENIILDKLYEILSPRINILKKYTKNTVIEHIL